MIDLVNVYTYYEIFGKTNYSLEDMQHLSVGTVLLDSKAGLVRDGRLLLHEKWQRDFRRVKGSTVFLFHELKSNDRHEFALTSDSRRPFFQSFPGFSVLQRGSGLRGSLFFFQSVDDQQIDVNFDADTNRSYIGPQPQRQSHKIGELTADDMIRFQVNGKHDFSATGRRERSYSEFAAVIHRRRLEVDEVEFVNSEALVEKLTLGDCKVIDERKRLY
jgi:hypothetical protein